MQPVVGKEQGKNKGDPNPCPEDDNDFIRPDAEGMEEAISKLFGWHGGTGTWLLQADFSLLNRWYHHTIMHRVWYMPVNALILKYWCTAVLLPYEQKHIHLNET